MNRANSLKRTGRVGRPRLRTRAVAAAVSAAFVALVLPASPASAVPDFPGLPDFQKYCGPEYEPFKEDKDFPQFSKKRPWERDWLRMDDLRRFATGKGVKVAVVDTGAAISENYPNNESGQNLQFDGASIDKENRADFSELGSSGDSRGAFFDCDLPTGTDSKPQDGFHGTKVSSLIMAQPIKESGMVGIAPEATLLPIRVKVGQTEGGGQETLAEGIRWAVDKGAKVISCSIVSYSDNNALRSAIEYADQNDVTVVVAAGNKRDEGQKPGTGYPAMYAKEYPNVIVVGSHGRAGQLSTFSEFNAVTVAAPGELLTTAFPYRGNYTADNGTSFAAPLVAGTAALLIDQAQRAGKTLTPADIRRRIELTAADAPADKPDKGYGFGLLDPYAALTQPIDNPNATIPPEKATGVQPLPPPTPPDNTLRNIALAITGLAIATAIAILATRSTYRQIRERSRRLRRNTLGRATR